jgi:3-oxo-5-alpha-steroid 4-dehydrogenase 1
MEIVSPMSFIFAFLLSPLDSTLSSLQHLRFSYPPSHTSMPFFGKQLPIPNASSLLALLFLTHYANRAILSPLRTPMRSKSHIIVPLLGIIFNVVNGSLLGTFVSALARAPQVGFQVHWWKFWVGVGLWVLGISSNIWHDEILLAIRRTPKNIPGPKMTERSQPSYTIPYGGLYQYVSYPNYFSEWIEWTGFAIAAAALTEYLPASHPIFPFAAGRVYLGEQHVYVN